MKKIITSIVCLVLAMCIMLSFSGCSMLGGDRAALIGTWEGTIDLSNAINSQLTAENEEDAELTELLKVSDFKIGLVYNFNSNGTYSIEGDEEITQASIDKMKTDMRAGLITYFENTIDEANLDITVNELLAMSDTDLDTLMDEAFSELNVESLIGTMEGEGNFEAKDGKLYCSDGLDYAVDRAVYETYEINGDTLTITGGSEEDDPEEQTLLDAIYPMVFTKVK